MRYFLEYDKNKKVIGWIEKNVTPYASNLTEVEPSVFKDELGKIGVDFMLEEEKIKNNKSDIQDLGESTAYVLEDSSVTAEMLVYALEEIENLKLEIETLKGGN